MDALKNRERFKAGLDQAHDWPSVYMFKFILEPEPARSDALLQLFKEGSEVLRRYSKGGKYMSITVREVMMNADEVMDRYDAVAKIQGVIVL